MRAAHLAFYSCWLSSKWACRQDQQVSQITSWFQWRDFGYCGHDRFQRLLSTSDQLANFYDHSRSLPYNGILGRPWISEIDTITSATYYLIIGGGVRQINNNQVMARKCSAQGLKRSKQAQFIHVSRIEQAGEEEDWKGKGKAIPQ